MTDIVERLRDADISGHGSYSALVREAADEIERLRRELSYHAHTDEDIKVQNAEIERLRSLLADKHYIQIKADYHRGHLSHYGWLQAREQGGREKVGEKGGEDEKSLREKGF